MSGTEGAAAEPPSVVVVLDPDFGERLKELWPGSAVWIVMSRANKPVIEALWSSAPDHSHLTGITGVPCDEATPPEELLLVHLWDIDLHHGPNSSRTPYRVLKVIGAFPTAAVRKAVRELGFDRVTPTREGFSTLRSETTASAW